MGFTDISDEWDLMVLNQDIEIGDTVDVVAYGVAEPWIFVGADKTKIHLKTSGGKEAWFSRQLEEINGPGFIQGKAAKPVRLKR